MHHVGLFIDPSSSLVLVHTHRPQSDYFSYFFKKVTNEKFQDYFAKMRIKKAKELLKNTNLGVVDIASQCGFNNMSNFYRLFQKYNGTRPRKKAAEEKA